MLPAHEGFDLLGSLLLPKTELRLVVDTKLFFLQRTPEVVLKLHTLQGPLIHARLEHTVIGRTLLGLVHGRVCVPKQLLCGLRAGVAHGDADAGPHKQLTPSMTKCPRRSSTILSATRTTFSGLLT